MNNQQTVVNNSGASPKWSDKYGQYYIEYQKDGKTYKMWMEESKSIEQKLQEAEPDSPDICMEAWHGRSYGLGIIYYY